MNDPLRMTEMTGWLNKIVNSWRKLVQRGGDPLMEAKEVLARLDRYKPCLLPDVQTYSMVVDAVATQGRDGPGVALFAEQVLERMHCESHVNPLVLPNVITYSSVVNAWAKSGLPEGPEKAEAVFRRVEEAGLKPNTISFNTVINAWANRRDPVAARRAEAILLQMEKLCEAGNVDVKPNRISYNSVIDAWAKSGDPSAGKRAEAILHRMLELYEAGDHDVKPGTFSFSSVITAWANSRDPSAGERAEAILARMLELHEAGDHDVKPDTVSFSSVITAWAKSGDPSAGRRAEAILVQMQEMSKAGNRSVSPDVMTYTSIISAWSNCKNQLGAERASVYLEHMKKLAAAGNVNCQPNKFTYKAVIRAWSQSGHPDTASTGYTAIFERLLDSRHITVRTKTDYFKVKDSLKCGRLYYTGPIEDWFVASETEEYYSYGVFRITNYFAKCAYGALDRMDEQGFNFTEYDQDGDGVIDRVVILHSGYVAEGGGTDCINGKPHGSHRMWSHATTAPETPEDGWYSKDGI